MMKMNKQILKRILSYVAGYRLLVVLSLLGAAASVASTLYAPILTGRGIDLILGAGAVDFSGIKKILLQLFVCIAVTAVSQLLMNLINNEITYRVVRDVRIAAFSSLSGLPVSTVDAKSHGDLVSRVVSDIDTLADGLLLGFSQLFTGVVTIAGTLGFMLSINVPIALVVVVLTPLSFFIASFIAGKTHRLFVRQAESKGELTAFADEYIGEGKLVQAFSYEEDCYRRFAKINEALEQDSMKATFYSSLTNPCTRFVNGLCYAAVGVIGAVLAIKRPGSVTVGQLTAFLSYANQYTKPFNEISNVITELQNAIACAGRVFELMDETPEQPDGEHALSLQDPRGEIRMEKVAFSYDKEKRLIENLNLEVQAGMRVAIVGPTGSGKSTLINLLMRFYDVDEGAIRVDGNDIRDLRRAALRENFGMVLQETWLKSGTVAENIAYGCPEATREEIVEAAKLAHSYHFICRLPRGFDTVLGEDGGSLSQGEKQLLCITRVMLRIPPMLILDEATSSIDTRTEVRIQKAFHRMMQGRTSFIVAHRLSTIRGADLILVMKDGVIKEQGTHASLMRQNGFYARLYNA